MPHTYDEQQNTETYQDELSNAVEDGGGCTETWEQLQKLRAEPDTERPQASRRGILRAIGAAGATFSGIGTATAKGLLEHKQQNVGLTNILLSDPVQQILKRLKHPSPEDVTAPNFGRRGPVKLNLEEAESMIVTAKKNQGSRVVKTTVPSDVGRLIIIKSNDIVLSPSLFKFDSNTPSDIKSTLDLDEEIGWPNNVAATIFGTNTQTGFRRETTSVEQEKITEALGFVPDSTGVFAQQNTSGYSALETSSEDRSIRYELSTDFNIRGENIFASVSSGQITTQGCGENIASCLSVLLPLPTPCLGCGYICVTPIPGVSQAACIVCLLATCGAFVLAYAACTGVDECV